MAAIDCTSHVAGCSASCGHRRLSDGTARSPRRSSSHARGSSALGGRHDRRRLQTTSGSCRQQIVASAHADPPPGQQQQHEEARLRFGGSEDDAVPSGVPSATGNGASAITLHYSSGWQRPTMLYSLQGAEWTDCTMDAVTSSGQWKSATFRLNGATAAPGQPEPPLLEFVITDGRDWDKPISGGNYVINERGRFMLRDGEIAAVEGEPVLVVSDLDDTMIGDDDATAVFKRFWDTVAVPRGSRLVYNTGRALHKCTALFEEKRQVLPQPDCLITSVGTKVYNHADGEWVVDQDHVALLDQDWDLNVVRDAAYAALASVGRDSMHFRPPDEQNEHKVTCGVSVAALQLVLRQVQRDLKRGGVKARLITSGTGDWRFLDIVSCNAGKLLAMEYARQKLGFSHDATVAAGDSGNDIAMFEGHNRGVLVSNSQQDLLDWLQRQQGSDDGRLVLAREPRARGILEGLARFGFL